MKPLELLDEIKKLKSRLTEVNNKLADIKSLKDHINKLGFKLTSDQEITLTKMHEDTLSEFNNLKSNYDKCVSQYNQGVKSCNHEWITLSEDMKKCNLCGILRVMDSEFIDV